jgi:hypothetical protein
LIDGNLKAQRLWWKKTKRKRGAQIGNSNAAKDHKSNHYPIMNCSKQGTSKAYLLDRLESEAPALYDDVLRGKKKAKAAAREAGIIKEKITAVERGKSAVRMMTAKERREFIAWLKEEGCLE